jgi:hypothetical protein
MSPQEEALKVPGLEKIGLALIQYAQTLLPSSSAEVRGRRVVLSPNFVAFTFQPRARTIRISLRGFWREFEAHSELPLMRGRGGSYSECVLAGPHQLLAAAKYIRRAAEIYQQRKLNGREHR